MHFEPSEVRVAVVEVVQPRIEIVTTTGTDATGAMAVSPRRPSVDAHEPGDANATAALMSLWAGTLLLKDILKDDPAADEMEKLKVQHGKCDCC